ncbi:MULTISPECIES: hypothetical protein [unclassified Microcoleus]
MSRNWEWGMGNGEWGMGNGELAKQGIGQTGNWWFLSSDRGFSR